MTFPVFNGLFDASTDYFNDDKSTTMREDIVDGHIIAIDLSEPMDRIVDKDEDLESRAPIVTIMPYILKLAREKISKGGEDVLKEFEEGFTNEFVLASKLKDKPAEITEEELVESYKKYRSVMGTAGRNMALNRAPLADIFYTGMAKAAESVGCGNEIEDSIRDRAAKIPSWPLFYSLKMNDAKSGFEETMNHSESYLSDARDALEKLPDKFSHTKFLEFLFLTVEHYNQFWYKKLQEENIL